MKESVFSKQLRDDIKGFFEFNIHIYLIQDMMRTGKKPYDFYCLIDGKFIAFELKVENGKSFPINKVQPHQPAMLREVEECGGLAYFLIAFPREKRCFILSFDDWNYTSEKFLKVEVRKSIPFDYFCKNFEYFDRKKIAGYTAWDIRELFSKIFEGRCTYNVAGD